MFPAGVVGDTCCYDLGSGGRGGLRGRGTVSRYLSCQGSEDGYANAAARRMSLSKRGASYKAADKQFASAPRVEEGDYISTGRFADCSPT